MERSVACRNVPARRMRACVGRVCRKRCGAVAQPVALLPRRLRRWNSNGSVLRAEEA
jgi:hypothetical protein